MKLRDRLVIAFSKCDWPLWVCGKYVSEEMSRCTFWSGAARVGMMNTSMGICSFRSVISIIVAVLIIEARCEESPTFGTLIVIIPVSVTCNSLVGLSVIKERCVPSWNKIFASVVQLSELTMPLPITIFWSTFDFACVDVWSSARLITLSGKAIASGLSVASVVVCCCSGNNFDITRCSFPIRVICCSSSCFSSRTSFNSIAKEYFFTLEYFGGQVVHVVVVHDLFVDHFNFVCRFRKQAKKSLEFAVTHSIHFEFR